MTSIFIAYSRDDQDFCEELFSLLHGSYEVWYDRELLGGELWEKSIDGRIMVAEFFLLITSQSSLASDQCKREVDIAIEHDKIIIPLEIEENLEYPDDLKHLRTRQVIKLSRHITATEIAQLFRALNNLKKPTFFDEVSVFIPPTDQRKYNDEFYEYFKQKFRDATGDIYLTGDGFSCENEENISIARDYSESLEDALDKGVRLVRLQTQTPCHPEWATILANIVRNYPSNFDLYVIKPEFASQIASVCVIDPHSQDDNVVEIMVSIEMMFGTAAQDLAGAAIFIEGHQALAQDLSKRIHKFMAEDLAIKIKDYDHAIDVLMGTSYYFSFGSNMLAEQMQERCPSAKFIGKGILRDHKIVFNRKGSYRPGGVASFEESYGDRIYGVIWEINNQELATLDEIEDPNAYDRVSETVFTTDGQKYQCEIYKARPQGKFTPDQEYLEILIQAAKDVELPEEYIADLEDFRT